LTAATTRPASTSATTAAPPIPRDAGTLPIGLTVELEERADAARGAWRVFKTALGDEVLELARDGCRSGCQSVSWKSLGVTAGTRTAAA
jgi:hypothetical protein